MCNLYSITSNQAAIIALFRVLNRYVGNLPPLPERAENNWSMCVLSAGAADANTAARAALMLSISMNYFIAGSTSH